MLLFLIKPFHSVITTNNHCATCNYLNNLDFFRLGSDIATAEQTTDKHLHKLEKPVTYRPNGYKITSRGIFTMVKKYKSFSIGRAISLETNSFEKKLPAPVKGILSGDVYKNPLTSEDDI